MRIAVIGSGYVGTTLAAGLADAGHDVTAIDIDAAIVETINDGRAPIHEPGLEDLLERVVGNGLTASTDYGAITDAELVFLAVGTPSREDGSIDISALRGAILEALAVLNRQSERADGHTIVIKSTVTPPQVAALAELIDEESGPADLELATNPEFLREGTAVEDFQTPDKLVFGTASARARERLANAYEPIIEATDPEVIETDPETAAMIKYANNAFLAAKISVINEIGNICKEFDLDAYEVAEAIGTDHRISEAFLRSGVGFGGSCFPKDVRALNAAALEAGYSPALLEAVLSLNDQQPIRLLEFLERRMDPEGRRVAVLGLAFKPGTDDIRNSRAIPLIGGLLERGADVVAYDPVAAGPMRERFPAIEYAESAAEALSGAEAALVVTDWDEFGALDEAFDAMARPIVIDGRRIITRREGIDYEGLTW